ncbi:MAG TPA: avidin/streptavidin family protein [Solirubrobacteraceae bacterium]|jgi:hypothetical protein
MSFAGTWYNELNSKMILKDQGNGLIVGTYESAVGEFKGVAFPLTGSYDPRPEPTAQAIGFVVTWSVPAHNAYSVTSWSGQYDGKADAIGTTWLLTSATGLLPEQDWCSTLVGQDDFIRTQSKTAAGLGKAAARGVSHPMVRS